VGVKFESIYAEMGVYLESIYLHTREEGEGENFGKFCICTMWLTPISAIAKEKSFDLKN